MKIRIAAAVMLVLGCPSLQAHRLDEYLQATILSIQKDELQGQITLTPGVAVFSFVMAAMDTNADGTISDAEQRAYAARVLGDVSLSIDGRRLLPHLVAIRFPSQDDMKAGLGAIQIDFSTPLPRGGGARKISFENHHLTRISAYQVNCLVPADPDLRILGQQRNYTQSSYRVDYSAPGFPVWFGAIPLLLLTRLAWLLLRRAPERAQPAIAPSPMRIA
ncbi:MAG TPA: hypothetical protein VG456_13420 [Candidatus Sulfopaludibacter sp.]|jgi:hypothetical protein|nr:hypothetical protein [Candidatus Sulfopaludibacter sp.]